MDNSADVKIIAELDYTRAMAALNQFKAEVAKVGTGGAQDMGEMARAIGKSVDQMGQLTAAFRNQMTEIGAVLDGQRQVGRVTDETAERATRAARAQRLEMRQQIKDQEYLSKTLSQRIAIMARLDAVMRGQQISSMSAAQQQVINARFGRTAVQDYGNGGMQNLRAQSAALQQQSQMMADAARSSRAYELAMIRQSKTLDDLFRKSQAGGDAVKSQARAMTDAERASRAYETAMRRNSDQMVAQFRAYRATNEAMRDLGNGPPSVVQSAATRAQALQREAAAAKIAAANYREFHSAARGLGGASGMLWLTYGSMLPMALGAGAAATGINTVKQGGAMAENMAFVRQLSEDSAPSLEALDTQINDITKSLIQMGREGRFGAVELSDSMRVLAQAGYNAQQSLQILPSVNNLSVIGETSPEKAALAVAGTISAFDMQAEGASRVADVLAKAAALSQTDVNQLMESMKQASTVAQDYGASLEETGAVLTLLAKLNITGSAAGTAFRNMMIDLGGRTPKARAELERLGVSLYDGVGRLRAMRDVVGDLTAKLNEMTPAMRNASMKLIFDERGRKAMAAVLGGTAFNDTVRGLDTAGDNGGFAARQAAALNTTPLAEYKKAVGNLTSSLIEGFNESEDQIKAFAIQMQRAFASDDFKDFVRSITGAMTGLMDLTRVIGPQLRLILELGVGYGVARVAIGGMMLASRGLVTAWTAMSAAGQIVRAVTLSYTGAMAGGATATAALGAAAGKARLSLQLFQLSLGPIGVALAAAGAAYMLFHDQVDSSPIKVKVDNAELNKSVDFYQYEAISKKYESQLGLMMAATGKFKADSVKNIDDVMAQIRAGQGVMIELQKKVFAEQGKDSEAGKQYVIDRQTEMYRGITELATKHMGTLEMDGDKRKQLAVQLATAQVDIHNASMDLMAERARQAVIEQMDSAYKIAGFWEKSFAQVLGLFKNLDGLADSSVTGRILGSANGTVAPASTRTIEGYGKQTGDESTRFQVAQYRSQLETASAKGTALTPGQVATARAVFEYAKGKGIDVSNEMGLLQMQQGQSSGQVYKSTFDKIMAAGGQPAGATPDKGGKTKIDRSDSNAAKVAADLAKDTAKNYADQLKIREKLSLFTSEEMYNEQNRLDLAAAEKALAADREKILLDIARAQKAGNAEATANLQRSAEQQEREGKNSLMTLRQNQEAERVARITKKTLEDINVVLEARKTTVSALTALYGSTDRRQGMELSRMAEMLTITRARYDNAKQMEALTDAPVEVRMAALEANRLDLAQRILEIRKEEQRYLFDNAKSAADVGQSMVNALEEQISELERQRTTFVDDLAKGLSTGLQGSNKSLFEYIKNPAKFKESNNGQAYGLGNVLGDTGGAIFDQIADGLSKSLAQSTMQGFSTLLQQTGLETQADTAMRLANENVSMNTANMAQSLGITIPSLLNDIYNALSTTNGASPRELAAGTGGIGAVGADGKVTTGLTNGVQEMGNTTQSVLQQMGMTTSQVFGMMYMGINSFATGGIDAFKRFAVAAIAQMMMVYAIQKLIGLAAGAMGGGAAGGATAMPVNMGSSITMTPLANGTGYVTGPGGRRQDSIPAMLSHGEGVLNARAVSYYGPDMIDRMNQLQISRNNFANGGTIAPARATSSNSGGGGSLSMSFNFQGLDGPAESNAGFTKEDLQDHMEGAFLEFMAKHSRRGGQVYKQFKEIQRA